MKSLWKEAEAIQYGEDPLGLRVYTSQLLGKNSDLVLHGGGNTSVKDYTTNLFGEKEEVLLVKGSGWDLATIKKPGFAPVKLDTLRRMAELEQLSDTEMVRAQRAAMTDPNAPNPSVEAILHAIIPFKFVDHTHADAIVTITNTPDGEKRIKELYRNRVIIVPYVMPGFILAREIYQMTKDLNWSDYEGMILLNHGVFTFDDDAQKAYEKMIELVTLAEDYLAQQAGTISQEQSSTQVDLLALTRIRQTVSQLRGAPQLALLNSQPEAVTFVNLPQVDQIATRGPLTPDHVIRTKPTAAVIGEDPEKSLMEFSLHYKAYFEKHNPGGLTCLDLAPRWGVWPGHGCMSFGKSLKEARIISDIIDHTIPAIRKAEILGGWKALSAQDIFDMEYWELEQDKLKKAGSSLPFQGKIALVTGAAGGIGKACVESLAAQGAVVAALDINEEIEHTFNSPNIRGLICDVTDPSSVKTAVDQTVRVFGGLDILVSNAGIFPASKKIADMDEQTWKKSLDLNLSGHQSVLQTCIPYLSHGLDPAVVIIASKNVAAPGPGASAYSVAKAGLTQLARVAALELGEKGIRVNVLHPNQVFDTGIWTQEVLEQRARHYGLTIEEYKTNNILKQEITSRDVADMACALASGLFSKTTGAQIPIDGGNERVI